ncbi:hypothetical protein ACWGQ5_47090 [Streptomyces sp. NPDC055722]
MTLGMDITEEADVAAVVERLRRSRAQAGGVHPGELPARAQHVRVPSGRCDRRVDLLPAGSVSMDAVARSLTVSTRTLQRQLNLEGTTFQTVLKRHA